MASDDKQISENNIVNSGSTTVKYAVTGQWDPNGIVFCP